MNDSILYVEDGPDDVFFMQRAFKKLPGQSGLHVLSISGRNHAMEKFR